MRITRSSFALVALVGLVVWGCAPRRLAEPFPTSSSYDQVIEISNGASVGIMVRYFTEGGGPHPLGTVGAYQQETFTLHGENVSNLRVETASGARIPENANLIRIRRYKIDRATGEQVGEAHVSVR